MQRLIASVCVVCLFATSLGGAGCGYVVHGTHERKDVGTPRVVDDQTRYAVANVTVAGDVLTVALSRECVQVREVEVQTIEVTERDYHTWWLWASAGMVVFFGGFFAGFSALAADDGEDSPALGLGLGTLGVALAISGVGLYFELADHDQERVIGTGLDRETARGECTTPWPTGRVTLMATTANQAFEGEAHGDGRVTVPVGDARREVWLSDAAMQLALPDNLDWLDVTVPASTRTAMLGDERAAAERVYVWFEAGERYHDLLKAGRERVQGSMTGSRRYQFLSDATTRERIEQVVDQGGGSAEARRQSALEAARAEDVRKMVQLTITPIFDNQVQLSLAVFDTATGDQIYATQAPADLSDAFGALDVFGQLADSYVTWEHE